MDSVGRSGARSRITFLGIAIGDDGRGLAGTVQGGDGRPAGIGNGKGPVPERPFAVSGRTLGIDVLLPLLIETANVASGQVSGPSPFAQSPPKADVTALAKRWRKSLPRRERKPPARRTYRKATSLTSHKKQE